MKADKTYSGITPDHGTIMRVNERVTSDSTAALKEALSIYDSYYMGGHLRPVRRAVFMDRPMFGMSMMANNVPVLEVNLDTFLQSFKPYEDLLALDELLSSMGGTSHAPCITIQPATTVLANGQKFAETLVESQNAWYQNRANWLAGNNHITRMDIDVPRGLVGLGAAGAVTITRSALPTNAPYVTFHHVTVNAPPTRPVQEPFFYGQNDGVFNTVLLPIEGQGPAPFLAMLSNQDRDLWSLYPLRWGIFYQDQDVEIDSPLKKLAMIACLNHLFNYLDGKNHGLGQYTWPDASGAASLPYTPKNIGSTGHHIINRLLLQVARAAALKLEYLTADELPQSTEMQLIRAIANLLYFLDHTDLLIKALCNTSDIRQFMTMLTESALVKRGVQVEFLEPGSLGLVGAPPATDFQAGIFPAEAVEFFWTRILPLLPNDVFVNRLMTDLAFGIPPINATAVGEYEQWVRQGMIRNPMEDPAQTARWMANLSAFGSGAVKHMNMDMRADYLAGAILARLKESLPLVCSLLKGEVPGYEHLHTDERILSFDVASNLLDTINAIVQRDLVINPSALEWEEPYTGARYSTQWQAYTVRFPVYPIQYVIHDAARDCLNEIDMIRGNKKGAADLLSTVETAFETLGLSLIQCEPVMSFVNLNPRQGQGSRYLYMAGERQLNGTRSPSSTENELYGDVNVSHGALRVTSTYYVRSAMIWNQMLDMPHQVTARTNNPQPVPGTWHSYAIMTIPNTVAAEVTATMNAALAQAILNQAGGANAFVHVVDLNPAFRDIAVVCPYVQMLVQTPPEAFGFHMMSKVSFDGDQKICNIAGTPIVMDQFEAVAGVSADQRWRMPNLQTQMAYTATPVTHLILPLNWNAVR